MKYQRRVDLVAPLTALLAEHSQLSIIEADVIAAVPLAPARQRERGYNQAELLARALATSTRHPYVQGLYRTRETADQVGKNAAERHANVRGAFRADAGAFRKKCVLLIDDVCTTGATLDACAVALQAQGVEKVYGLTVARPRERVV
ncbi:MAG: ComF family protein [Rudaea sp.]